MNVAIHELANAVLKKSLLQCRLDELQQITKQYPYFGPAQLLLAKKLSIEPVTTEEDLSKYEEQVQKTSLYFQNRVWLHHLLNDEENNFIIDQPVIAKTDTPIMQEEPQPSYDTATNHAPVEEIVADPQEEQTIQQIDAFVEMPVAHQEPSVETAPEENNEPKTSEKTGEEPAMEVVEQGVEPSTEESKLVDAPVVDEINETQAEETREEAAEPSLSSFEMPALKIEPITTGTGLTFEPYHTVDYFASQGIRFKDDERPKDRFATQLRSFTEWLKTMKRVPVTEITSGDSVGEKKVEQMAEFSIAERHVITEAMAEVWKKQGNKGRAEEIYRKLSLLDPSKSSYFASKIEELKKPG